MKGYKFFISKGLGHPMHSLQLAFDMEITNKCRSQNSREFTPIPLGERSRAQVVCVEEEIGHGICALKNPTKVQ